MVFEKAIWYFLLSLVIKFRFFEILFEKFVLRRLNYGALISRENDVVWVPVLQNYVTYKYIIGIISMICEALVQQLSFHYSTRFYSLNRLNIWIDIGQYCRDMSQTYHWMIKPLLNWQHSTQVLNI